MMMIIVDFDDNDDDNYDGSAGTRCSPRTCEDFPKNDLDQDDSADDDDGENSECNLKGLNVPNPSACVVFQIPTRAHRTL